MQRMRCFRTATLSNTLMGGVGGRNPSQEQETEEHMQPLMVMERTRCTKCVLRDGTPLLGGLE